MSLAADYRIGTLSPEGGLYRCEDPVLGRALTQAQGLYNDILRDAGGNNEHIDPIEGGMRLQQAGIWAETYNNSLSSTGAAALRLVTAASHYGDVQRELDTATCRLPDEEYAPRIHNNCVYNGVIKDFGLSVPETYIADARKAMIAARLIVGHAGNQRPFEKLYRSVINGNRVELWGGHMLRYIWAMKQTDTLQDLQGIDGVMRVGKKSDAAIGVDFASSTETVRKKCGSDTHSSGQWGVRNGVLVLWPGITPRDMGDTFAIDDKVARPIFRKSVKGIIISALKSVEVAKIPWTN